MSSPFSQVSPAWLVQPTALINIFANPQASLKDLSSYVNVPNFTAFSSSIRQALYWRRRLSPTASNTTVIFSLLGEKGLCLPNVLEVFQALKSICDTTQVIEFYHAMNSSFIGISFNNPSEAAKVRTHFSFFKDCMVIHVLPSSSLVHHFKLLWLPPLFPDSRIHHFLSKHSVHHHFSRDFVSTDTNTSIPSNSVSGTMKLSSPAALSSIPHLIPLPSPHLGSALLILSGRASLCLKCGATGHIRRSCSSPRCAQCHHFHLAASECPSPSNSSSLITPWIELDSDLSSDTLISDSTHIVATECDHTPTMLPPVSMPVPTAISSSSSSSIDIVSQVILHNSSSSAHDPPMATSNEVTAISDSHPIVTKRITRSMSSSKRTFPSSTPSLASSVDICHFNAFNILPDETLSSPDDAIPHASTLPRSQSSDHLLTKLPSSLKEINTNVSSHDTSSHFSSNTSAVIAPSTISSYSDVISSLPSSKRAKISSLDHHLSSISASDPVLPSFSPSWADQAEMEIEGTDLSSPFKSTTDASLIPPALTGTSISDVHSQSSHLSNNASDTDESESNNQDDAILSLSSTVPDHSRSSSSSTLPTRSLPGTTSVQQIYITGFPNNTNRATVAEFLKPLVPNAMWHIQNSQHNFVGHFGIAFPSSQDASTAMARDGQLHLNNIIHIRPPPIIHP